MFEAVLTLFQKLRELLRVAFATVLALAALGVMAWTIVDGRTDAAMYGTLARDVQTVAADRVDAAHDGAIVHLAGALPTSAEGVHDAAFDVAVDGFALRREVAMYQWSETRRGRRANQYFEYNLEWCACRHDSTTFHEPQGHENPPLALETAVLLAPDARFGAHALTDSLLAEKAFAEYEDAEPPYRETALARLVEDVERLPALAAERTAQGWRAIADGAAYYLGANENAPQLGDHTVTYTRLVETVPVSFVGVQRNGALHAYERTPGRGHLLARAGAADAKTMIDDAAGVDRAATNFMRAACLIVVTLALGALGARLHGVLAPIPVLGWISTKSRFGGGAVLGLVLGGAVWLAAFVV